MDTNSLPIKDAVVTTNPQRKPEEMQPIYWFERDDGAFLCVKEPEAWDILKGRVQIMNSKVKFKYLGQSSGQSYWEEMKRLPELLKESPEKASDFIREVEAKERSTANPSIRPRNFDGRDLFGNPVNMNLGGLI